MNKDLYKVTILLFWETLGCTAPIGTFLSGAEYGFDTNKEKNNPASKG